MGGFRQEMPKRQAQLLAFIDENLKKRGRFPGVRAMQDHMGWKNETSVRDCLLRLAVRGEVSMTRGDRIKFHRLTKETAA